jgi:ABC-type transporter MlaC component
MLATRFATLNTIDNENVLARKIKTAARTMTLRRNYSSSTPTEYSIGITRFAHGVCRMSLLLAVCLAGSGPTAFAQTDQAVADFVAGINHTISLVAGKGGEGAPAFCSAVIIASFDFEAMAHVTSAGAWDRMNAQQRQAYRAAFLRRARKDCTFASVKSGGETLELVGIRTTDGGDRLVATRVTEGWQNGRVIVWRVRPDTRRRLRAVDVIVDGRSMAMAGRDAAKAALDRNDGDIDALIKSVAP